MAKNETKAVAVVQPPGALALPDYMKDANLAAGKEDINTQDLILPRVAIAQALTPQLSEEDPSYIDGLKLGYLFNTLTGAVYGKGPLPVVIVRRVKPYFHLVEGKGADRRITERNIPPTDPRCQWQGNTPPAATEFREFYALHAETGEPLGLSFKSTSVRAGRELDTFISLTPSLPLQGRVYNLTTMQRKNEHGTFYVFKVQPGGLTPPAIYQLATDTAASWAKANVAISEDHGQDDSPAPATPAERQPGDDTPF